MSVQEKSLKNQIADVQTGVETLTESTTIGFDQVTTSMASVTTLAEGNQTDIARIDTGLSGVETDLQNEITRATVAEVGLTGDVNLINTRLGFCQTMEYDGALSINTYPFCMGAGVPSSEKFGFFVNKPFKLTGYSFQVESESTDINVTLKIEGRDYDPITKTVQGPAPTWDVDASVGNTKFNVDSYMNALEHTQGVVSVRVNGAGLGAQSDRYRLTLFFEYF